MNELNFNRITSEMAEILRKKSSEYKGSIDNITMTGLPGISVRLLDKAMKFHNLTRIREKDQPVRDEELRDTLIHLANYCVIGVMLIDGTWNKIEIRR